MLRDSKERSCLNQNCSIVVFSIHKSDKSHKSSSKRNAHDLMLSIGNVERIYPKFWWPCHPTLKPLHLYKLLLCKLSGDIPNFGCLRRSVQKRKPVSTPAASTVINWRTKANVLPKHCPTLIFVQNESNDGTDCIIVTRKIRTHCCSRVQRICQEERREKKIVIQQC